MRLLAIAAIAALLGGCASSETVPASAADTREWNGTLEAQSGSDLRGAARANSVRGSTAAVVRIAGAEANAVHPWHIHAGTCGSGGAIVGQASAYQPLRANASGDATARGTINVTLQPGQSYYVNIHASPQNLGTIVACGQIR